MIPHTRAYRNFDAHPEPETLIACLDRIETYPTNIVLRDLTYEAVPGGVGVDVGCGHGRAVADLVERGIPAIGVDRSEVMVQAALQRFPSCRFSAADATNLPFPDETLQWYRAERLYLHLPDPLAALTEAKRVLAPGGKVIIADGDFDSIVLTSTDQYTTRKLLDILVDDLPQGRVGSRIPGLLTDAGFTDITFSVRPMVHTDLEDVRALFPEQAVALGTEAGAISATQAEAWLADLDQHARANRFVFAYMTFLSVASVPT